MACNECISNCLPFLNDGDTFTWTIRVCNNHATEDATNVLSTSTIPAGVSVDSWVASGGTSYDTITDEWDIGTLSASTCVDLELTMTVDDITQAPFTHVAVLTSDAAESIVLNNTDEDIIADGCSCVRNCIFTDLELGGDGQSLDFTHPDGTVVNIVLPSTITQSTTIETTDIVEYVLVQDVNGTLLLDTSSNNVQATLPNPTLTYNPVTKSGDIFNIKLIDNSNTGTVVTPTIEAIGVLTGSADFLDTETVTIDAKVYQFQDTLTNVDGNVQIASLPGTGVLTFAANVANLDTIDIGGKTYTFLATLVAGDGNVHIGATASDTIDNLVAAIMDDISLGETGIIDTDYSSATAIHPTVTAAPGAGDTMDVTAKGHGTITNLIPTTSAAPNATWGAATLTGGTDDLAGSLLNLLNAMNLTGAAGTDYAALMVLHPTVAGTASDATTLTVTSKVLGAAGNAIATTETASNAAWGAATLEGGEDAGVIVANTDIAGASATFTFTSIGESITVQSDGTNYFVI